MTTKFSNRPVISQGTYGEVQNFGGGAMVYADPRDNPNFKAPAPVAVVPTPEPKREKKEAPEPKRTPGLLERAKQDALVTEERQKQIRNEADMYAAQMRQARIDAINTTFKPRIDRELDAGKERLARVDALNFNKGIIGSGLDSANKDRQGRANEDVVRAIEDEKAVLINEAFEYADGLATKKAEQLTKEKQGIAESNVKRQQELYDTAAKALELFGKAGNTLDDIKKGDPQTYKNLTEVGGLSDFEIVSQLNKANPKMNAKLEFKDGVVYQYYVDPKTNEVKITTTKATDIPVDYKPQFAPDGTLIFMPDKFDPNKSISEQIKVGGNYSKPTEDKSGFSFSNEARGKLTSQNLSSSEIVQLEKDINQFGADKALEGIGDEKTRKAIKTLLSGNKAGGEQFLSADYFKKIFTKDQLKSAADEAGYDGGWLGTTGGKGVNDYIDHLTGLVDQYRVSGYTDEEILKMMQ